MLKNTITDRRLRKIADHYGLTVQKNQLAEECAELIHAISKTNRNPASAIAQANLIEELADVSIMLEQVVYLMSCRLDVIEITERKLDRTMRKMQEDEGEC